MSAPCDAISRSISPESPRAFHSVWLIPTVRSRMFVPLSAKRARVRVIRCVNARVGVAAVSGVDLVVEEGEDVDAREAGRVRRAFGGRPGDALVDVTNAIAVGVGEEVDEVQPIGGRVCGDGPQCQPLVPVPRALCFPPARSRGDPRRLLVKEDQDRIAGTGPYHREGAALAYECIFGSDGVDGEP